MIYSNSKAELRHVEEIAPYTAPPSLDNRTVLCYNGRVG